MFRFKKNDFLYVYSVTTYRKIDNEFKPCTAVWFDNEKYDPTRKYDLSNHTEWKRWDLHASNLPQVKSDLISQLLNLFPHESNDSELISNKITQGNNKILVKIADWLKHKLSTLLARILRLEGSLADFASEKFIAEHNEVSAAITDWLKHHQG